MMDKLAILNDLQYGKLNLEGQFLQGSNGTFLVVVSHAGNSMPAVYKPKAAEQPLWDFPRGTLCKREVAAYIFSEALGWNLVPPTTFRKEAPLGPGSLQAFIAHDPNIHYLNMQSENPGLRSKVLLFDCMVNNADRKAGHFIMDVDKNTWLIDHGLTFHEQEKLRTVAWDHAGEQLPSDLQVDIHRVLVEVDTQAGIYDQLAHLLTTIEIQALLLRMKTLLKKGTYPVPSIDRHAIPWPPI
jgi:hypothetical protein